MKAVVWHDGLGLTLRLYLGEKPESSLKMPKKCLTGSGGFKENWWRTLRGPRKIGIILRKIYLRFQDYKTWEI